MIETDGLPRDFYLPPLGGEANRPTTGAIRSNTPHRWWGKIVHLERVLEAQSGAIRSIPGSGYFWGEKGRRRTGRARSGRGHTSPSRSGREADGGEQRGRRPGIPCEERFSIDGKDSNSHPARIDCHDRSAAKRFSVPVQYPFEPLVDVIGRIPLQPKEHKRRPYVSSQSQRSRESEIECHNRASLCGRDRNNFFVWNRLQAPLAEVDSVVA